MYQKNLIRILINSGLGIILILVWSKFINFNQITSTIKTINSRFLFLFFIIFFLSTSARSLRLQILLKSYKFRFKDLLFLNFLSQFLSFIIPIRAGEITKGVYLNSQMQDVGFIKSLLWVFIDRFLDFWIYILLAGILVFSVPSNLPPKFQFLTAVLVIIFSLAALMMILANELSKKMIKNFHLPKSLQNLASAFVILQQKPLQILKIFFLTLLAVGLDLAMFVLVYLAFNPNIDILKVVLGSTLTVFTFLVPAAPGYVGSVEASNLAIFSGVMGFNPNLASSAAIVMHILNIITLPIFGLISLYLLKFNLDEVWTKLRGKSNPV